MELRASLFLKPAVWTVSQKITCPTLLWDFSSTYKQASYADGKTWTTASPGPEGGQALTLILPSCHPLPLIKGRCGFWGYQKVSGTECLTQGPPCIAHMVIQGTRKQDGENGQTEAIHSNLSGGSTTTAISGDWPSVPSSCRIGLGMQKRNWTLKP